MRQSNISRLDRMSINLRPDDDFTRGGRSMKNSFDMLNEVQRISGLDYSGIEKDELLRKQHHDHNGNQFKTPLKASLHNTEMNGPTDEDNFFNSDTEPKDDTASRKSNPFKFTSPHPQKQSAADPTINEAYGKAGNDKTKQRESRDFIKPVLSDREKRMSSASSRQKL